MSDTPGLLVVLGTPIGNLDDLSPRAVKALRSAEVIFCEDTRRTRALLSAVGVPAPRLVRVDQHTERSMTGPVVEAVAGGATALLLTDAGMPTISDPGHLVVRSVAAAGLAIEVVPGPDAVSAALALSGLPGSQFRFAGFLPRKGRDRADALAVVANESATTVIYEAPYRLERTLADLAGTCGSDREVAVVHEITKLHEGVWRGQVGEAGAWLAASGPAKGEWVIVVAGRSREDTAAAGADSDEDIAAALTGRLAAGLDRRDAIADVAVEMGLPKRRVYDVAVNLRKRQA